MFSRGSSVLCYAGVGNPPEGNNNGDISAESCNRECLNDAKCKVATYDKTYEECSLFKGDGKIECGDFPSHVPLDVETFTKRGLCIYVFFIFMLFASTSSHQA